MAFQRQQQQNPFFMQQQQAQAQTSFYQPTPTAVAGYAPSVTPPQALPVLNWPIFQAGGEVGSCGFEVPCDWPVAVAIDPNSCPSFQAVPAGNCPTYPIFPGVFQHQRRRGGGGRRRALRRAFREAMRMRMGLGMGEMPLVRFGALAEVHQQQQGQGQGAFAAQLPSVSSSSPLEVGEDDDVEEDGEGEDEEEDVATAQGSGNGGSANMEHALKAYWKELHAIERERIQQHYALGMHENMAMKQFLNASGLSKDYPFLTPLVRSQGQLQRAEHNQGIALRKMGKQAMHAYYNSSSASPPGAPGTSFSSQY